MKKIQCLLITASLLIASTAFASGGAWKLGAFGPYWDENDWPEYTPMYWMEEFLNTMDSDEDEIRDWMRVNPDSVSDYVPNYNRVRPDDQQLPSFDDSMPLNREGRQMMRLPNGAYMPKLSAAEYEQMPDEYRRVYRQGYQAALADYQHQISQIRAMQKQQQAAGQMMSAPNQMHRPKVSSRRVPRGLPDRYLNRYPSRYPRRLPESKRSGCFLSR